MGGEVWYTYLVTEAKKKKKCFRQVDNTKVNIFILLAQKGRKKTDFVLIALLKLYLFSRVNSQYPTSSYLSLRHSLQYS